MGGHVNICRKDRNQQDNKPDGGDATESRHEDQRAEKDLTSSAQENQLAVQRKIIRHQREIQLRVPEMIRPAYDEACREKNPEISNYLDFAHRSPDLIRRSASKKKRPDFSGPVIWESALERLPKLGKELLNTVAKQFVCFASEAEHRTLKRI